MSYQHQSLMRGKWKKLTFLEQMANVGSEIERAILWKQKGNHDYSRQAFFRALELLDFTLDDRKNLKRLKELCRLREALVDYFDGSNQFSSSDKLWHNYFFAFNWAAQLKRKKVNQGESIDL